MNLGILGFAKSGKTTLFNLLTGSEADTGKFSASGATHIGVAMVPDRRLEQLKELYDPKRYTPATVTYIDIPGVRKGEASESLDLAKLRDVDALMHVVRAFDDPDIVHPQGGVDAMNGEWREGVGFLVTGVTDAATRSQQGINRDIFGEDPVEFLFGTSL